MGALFFTLLFLLAIVLILLVLVQRGRGGGLAGALGGMGGSSAFGAKAGDVFTRITMWVAAIWIVVCILARFWADHYSPIGFGNASAAAAESDTAPVGLVNPAETPPLGEGTATTPQSPGAEGGGEE